MKVASLVLAVANTMDPLIRLGLHTSTSLQRSSHFGIDAERLRVSFKRERRQVEAMRGLLLMKAEGLGIDTTVFEQLDEMWQADLLDELRQLRALTRELEEIENRYYIFAPLHATPSSRAQPLTETVVSLTLAEDREAKLQSAATKPQLLRWGLKDGKRAARALDDLHTWLLTPWRRCLWTCFKTPDKLQTLRQYTEVAALGLTDAVELRCILLSRSKHEAFRARFPAADQSQAKRDSSIGKISESARPDRIQILRTKRRCSRFRGQLTSPVNWLHFSAARNTPKLARPFESSLALGITSSLANRAIASSYNIPSNLRPEPVSLLTAINAGEPRYRSTIKHKLQLAYGLSLSVYQLHLVGWLHKSIRSENIVFFPDASATTENVPGPQTSLAVPDALVDRRTKECYTEPWLFGFEYSRVISQGSDLAMTDRSIANNIYRHPERWNAPTHRFDAIHDIYALGTFLLEIGLWRPLLSLSESGFARAAEAASSVDTTAAGSTKEGVKAQLLRHAARRLPFTVGRIYCEVVILCLSGVYRGVEGQEGFDVVENDHQALEKSFREKVVDSLRKSFLNA